MEYPYVALLWTPSGPEHAKLAERLASGIHSSGHWHQSLQRDGLIAFIRTPHTHILDAFPLPDQLGLVLGALFRQNDNSPIRPRDIVENRYFGNSCQASWGAHLTQHYWGAYVAFMAGPRPGDWLLMRDCSGMIPCYYITVEGITIAFSDVRDIEPLCEISTPHGALISLEINWRYIVGFLASSQMQIRETGLKNIYELLAGESLESNGSTPTVRSLWDPIALAQHHRGACLEEASRDLRHITQSCINAWAGVQDRVLHRLSGGFDSSLVLALLTRAPRRPNVACLNAFAFGPGEDERRYARLVADTTGTTLIEHAWDTPALDESCLALPLTAKPTIPHLLNGLDAPVYNTLCRTGPVDAIWTGQGGDHLFWAAQTTLGAVDYWRHHGFERGLFAALLEATSLTGRSVPHIVVDILTDTFARDSSSAHFLDTIKLTAQSLFLSSDAYSAALPEYICHPWLTASAHLPPGKRYQIVLLAEVLNRHRPLYGLQTVQEFHPLLSQPLIELCLRIPVYQLSTGGKTRGLARIAFRDILPAPIVAREQKGQTTRFTLELLRRSARFLSPAILEGHLANHDLLNLNALAPILRTDAPIAVTAIFPLLACISAETWAQGWLNHRPAAAQKSSISLDDSTTHSQAPSTPPCAALPAIRTADQTDSTSPNLDFVPGKF